MERPGRDSCVKNKLLSPEQEVKMALPHLQKGEKKEVNMTCSPSETDSYNVENMLETLLCAPLKPGFKGGML